MTPAFNKGQEFLFIPPGQLSAFNHVWHLTFAALNVCALLIFAKKNLIFCIYAKRQIMPWIPIQHADLLNNLD